MSAFSPVPFGTIRARLHEVAIERDPFNRRRWHATCSCGWHVSKIGRPYVERRSIGHRLDTARQKP